MIKSVQLGIVATIAAFLFSAVASAEVILLDGNPVRGMWVENTPTLNPLADEASMDALIDFSVEHGVNRLYVAAYPYVEIFDYEGTWQFKEDDTGMQYLPTLLNKAAVAGIEVEALFGATTWADPYPDPLVDPPDPDYFWKYEWQRKLVGDLIDMSQALGSAGFAGIHLDMEYWAFWEDYDKDLKSQYQQAKELWLGGDPAGLATMIEIEENYLALLEDINQMIPDAEPNMRLAVDLPTWMEDDSARATQLQDIFAFVDSATIMTYRDEASWIFELSEDELALADGMEMDLEILLSALTMPVDDVDVFPWSTFADENEVLMELQLALASGMISEAEYETFAGYGIYHYETYSNMAVPEPSTLVLALMPLMALGAAAGRRLRRA